MAHRVKSLRAALGDRPGEVVKLTIIRGGAKLELTATLGSKS